MAVQIFEASVHPAHLSAVIENHPVDPAGIIVMTILGDDMDRVPVFGERDVTVGIAQRRRIVRNRTKLVSCGCREKVRIDILHLHVRAAQYPLFTSHHAVDAVHHLLRRHAFAGINKFPCF